MNDEDTPRGDSRLRTRIPVRQSGKELLVPIAALQPIVAWEIERMADPFVQGPSNTQSHNRYSYVVNNPLSHTDPSEYSSPKEAARSAVGIRSRS